MQPNNDNNAYPQAAVPNNGGQPYPQTPPEMAQQSVPAQQPAQAIPRSAYEKTVPGSAIPEVMPDESVNIAHKKTVLADGTVLPDVIYVKKRGAQIGFAITSFLLVACAAFGIKCAMDLMSTKETIDGLREEVKDKNIRLETVRRTFDFNSIDQITEENLKELVATTEGAVDVDLSSFNSGTGIFIKWLRISANSKYLLANVSYYGSSSYYYREGNNGWTYAFSQANAVSCRDVTRDAMRVITELGGVDKSVSSTGKQYDCLDPKDGDKLYDFADAMNAGIYKN